MGTLNPKKKTRREAFLERMDAIVPWDSWIALVEPNYHSQARGRRVRGAETMLRMYLLQVMFGLSDEGTEDAILDSRSMQRFMHLDLMSEQVPDATTLAKMRHSLKAAGVRQSLCFTPELRSLKRQGSRRKVAPLWM
ncbi:MAG: transposase [Coriobacteriaceae bacterium]|nr:MAG: transposase [Coriobacteriaceae bacterium]